MTINTVPATPDMIRDCILEMAKDEQLRKTAAWIHGAPGLGKSDVVRQIAESLNWQLIDLRLTRMDSTDLSGLPYLDQDTKQTIFYLPEFLPTEESIKASGKDGCIIFLDELSACEPRLQAVSYELLLDRRVGKYKVPDNVMIVAAGNKVEDQAVAYDLTSAISDRFVHFDVVTSIQSWLKWTEEEEARGNSIHVFVKAFLKARPEFLDQGFKAVADNEDKINPSPRTWSRVSTILHKIKDEAKLKIILPGILGAATCHEFMFAKEELSELLPMNEYIKLGLEENDTAIKAALPTKLTGLYGLSYSLPQYCQTEEDFIAACYIFNVLGSIEDNLPRKELLVTSVITLFQKAQKVDNTKLPHKIARSKAYKTMREEHMQAFSDLINVK